MRYICRLIPFALLLVLWITHLESLAQSNQQPYEVPFRSSTPLTPASDTSPQHIEDTIQSAYGALSFVCSLRSVTNLAEHQHTPKPSYASPDLAEASTVPYFVISDMKIGTIESIADRKLKEFITVPSGQTLRVRMTHRYHAENNASSAWRECQADWATFTAPFEAHDDNSVLGMSMRELASVGSGMLTTRATYTHYAAFQVTTTLDGKTIGPNKALFLFGYDKQGKEVVAPQDLSDGDQGLWTVLNEPIYPEQLLTSSLRDTPAVAEWARNNTMANANCSAARTDLCCHDGRCSLIPSKVSHDLALPLPNKQ